jgi:peptidoglycan/xylan/chitin deacetylase (PgdA/CDA1 family)
VSRLGGPTRDFVGYGANPPVVRWPGGARLALNIAVNYEEGSERSFANGDDVNESLGEIPRTVAAPARDLATESVYEYGSRAGIFRILRVLEEFGMPATMFAAAVALERNPDVCDWIRRLGHDVCGHGYRWSEDWTVSRDEERERIALAVASITETCGRRPTGWYSRWMPSEHTRELLVAEGGFAYDSNAYNDDLPYWVRVDGRAHLVVPYSLTYNDSRYSAHGLTPSAFVDQCVRGIDELVREGAERPKMMSIGLHARFTGQAARASALREILEHVRRRGDVWVARREDIASCWSAQFPAPTSL